ncbi:unnamed protein product [Mytilus edulis]|uniref:Uncharacterized protein n=1 Tax=Mytilus edulis TaxID=6550 RepID=A0A8S3RKT5_MYTED|nr:unnamed protein product [Mytilus edulis]
MKTSKNMDEITEAQQNDEGIKLILKMKSESNEKPKWEEISVQSKELKTYWSQWDQLKLIDNVLYREWISNINSEMKQLILPSCWKEEILKMLHDDPVGGHFGVHRTLSRVSSRFYWAGYKENIEQCCKRCEICNSRKGPQKRARGAIKQYLVGAPLERVTLDILGPLPITTSGNKLILVLTDYFSRWSEAYPIPNQEAETITTIFVVLVCQDSVADAVWIFNPTKTKGKSPKLKCQWTGPFLIIEAYTDLIYKVKSSPNSRDRVLHHDRLKPFIGNFNNWLQKSKDDLDEGDSKDPAVEPEIEKANITRKSTRDTKPPERYSPSN